VAPRLALLAGHGARLALCAALAWSDTTPAAAEEPVQAKPQATPQPQPEQKPRTGWAVLPIATYAPETQLGLGVFGTHFFRVGDAGADTRPSSLSAVGLYTFRQQLITELIPELYWDEMRSHVWARLDYRRYPNKLWAVGNDAPASSGEPYTEDRVRFQSVIDHALEGPLRIEGKLEIAAMALRAIEPGGLIDRAEVPGASAGRTVGVGPGLLWDTRDHLLVPRHGELFEASAMLYDDLIGSQHDFGELVLDLRTYRSVTEDQVLALQLYAQVQLGEAPFYKLPMLGGQDMLRGYYEGRFRDEALLAVQAEYRLPLLWRISGVLHAALGQVAKNPLRLGERTPKWSLGPGLRLLLNTDERLNLRADLGVCSEGYGIYVGIAEAF
jgi:hypothetical protein